MSPVTTPLNPANASPPLATISHRMDVVRRSPPRTGAANNIESGKKTSQPTISSAYATEGHLKDRKSGSHECPANAACRPRVKMMKCRLHVSAASMPMKTTDVRLSTLTRCGAHACTATMSATIAGIMTMIRISRIEKIGSPIGSCADSSDKSPTVSVTT